MLHFLSLELLPVQFSMTMPLFCYASSLLEITKPCHWFSSDCNGTFIMQYICSIIYLLLVRETSIYLTVHKKCDLHVTTSEDNLGYTYIDVFHLCPLLCCIYLSGNNSQNNWLIQSEVDCGLIMLDYCTVLWEQ